MNQNADNERVQTKILFPTVFPVKRSRRLDAVTIEGEKKMEKNEEKRRDKQLTDQYSSPQVSKVNPNSEL